MAGEEKTEQVKTAKLCLNCLSAGHQLKNCNSSHCKKCHHKKNTFLHQTERTVAEPIASTSNDSKTTRELFFGTHLNCLFAPVSIIIHHSS